MTALLRHAPGPGPRALWAGAAFTSTGDLALRYRIDADPDSLRIPVPSARNRVDGLWRHTCLELFIQGEGAPAYREFNFSPSGDWQAFGFSDYRQGGPLAGAVAPASERREESALSLNVLLPAANLPPGRRLHLGLTAVVEGADGNLSYWALRHPPGRPDFHHPEGFILELDRP